MNSKTTVEPCPNKDGCVLREVFIKIKDEIQAVLDRVTLKELSQRARAVGYKYSNHH